MIKKKTISDAQLLAVSKKCSKSGWVVYLNALIYYSSLTFFPEGKRSKKTQSITEKVLCLNTAKSSKIHSCQPINFPDRFILLGGAHIIVRMFNGMILYQTFFNSVFCTLKRSIFMKNLRTKPFWGQHDAIFHQLLFFPYVQLRELVQLFNYSCSRETSHSKLKMQLNAMIGLLQYLSRKPMPRTR